MKLFFFLFAVQSFLYTEVHYQIKETLMHVIKIKLHMPKTQRFKNDRLSEMQKQL